MEKAYWDTIMDSMKEDSPDYSRVLDIVKEVRDELIGMAPLWKQEIVDNIDMDGLSQVKPLTMTLPCFMTWHHHVIISSNKNGVGYSLQKLSDLMSGDAQLC